MPYIFPRGKDSFLIQCEFSKNFSRILHQVFFFIPLSIRLSFFYLVSMPLTVEKTCPFLLSQTRSVPSQYWAGSTGNNFQTALFPQTMCQGLPSPQAYVALPSSQTPFALDHPRNVTDILASYDYDHHPSSFPSTFIDGHHQPAPATCLQFAQPEEEAEVCGAANAITTAAGLVESEAGHDQAVRTMKKAKSSCKGQKKRLSSRMNVKRKLVPPLEDLVGSSFPNH